MDEEIQEIMDKFDSFMDKKKLDLTSKYIVSKHMTERYWEEMKQDDDDDEDDLDDDEDLLDDLDDDEDEDDDEDDLDDDINTKKTKKKVSLNNMIKKSKARVKKPKAKIRETP